MYIRPQCRTPHPPGGAISGPQRAGMRRRYRPFSLIVLAGIDLFPRWWWWLGLGNIMDIIMTELEIIH